MKRTLVNAVLLGILLSIFTLQAAEKQFEPGRILTVEKKAHERILYYLVNTPVTKDDPYYELTLQSGDTIYWTEFTPRHAADDLPDGWQEEAELLIKVVDKHHVLVKQQGGTAIQLLLLKTTPGTAQSTAPKPPSKN
jgi:hypothetical protein